MGQTNQFKCTECGYGAWVSGGKDWGFIAVIQTMTCHQCRELVDVSIGREGVEGPTGNPKYDKGLGVCPKCGGVDVIAWEGPGPCPKCNGAMALEAEGVLWD